GSLPAGAHSGADAVLASPPASAATVPPVAVSGTIDELTVENRMDHTVTRYVALRLDEGRTLALSGADDLVKGARVEAVGRIAGNTLFVNRVSVLAIRDKAVSGAGAAVVSAQGMLTVVHADYFAEGRGEDGLVIQGIDGRATPLNVAIILDSLRAGMSV